MWEIALLIAAQSVPVLPGQPGLPPFPYGQDQTCEGTQRPEGARGTLDVQLGEPIPDALSRSSFRFPDFYAEGPVLITGERLDLRIRHGSEVLELPGIGGMHNTIVQVSELPGQGISLIGFSYQNRPLTVAEALDRAAHLRGWFADRGFTAAPPGTREQPNPQMGKRLAEVQSRAAAEAMLADETLGIPEVQLFRLGKGPHEIVVTLENWRRLTARMTGGRSVFDACRGREWGVQVYLSSDEGGLE